MIPITIQLKNFLSYGDPIQKISFGKYQLICLSGKNGHGKSALLDAITWALWGQARKTNNSVKPDAHLVRLGQTHMVVILDFIVNQAHYRVRREYAHNHGKGYSVLEFGIIRDDNSTPIPLTDKTIKATQAIIEKTIGIDFDSFINSAFLRQGNANEFSKRSPKERKEILASILGVDHYEKIRRRALEKIRIATTERQILISLQEQLNKKIQQKTLLHNERIAIDQTVTMLSETKKTHEETYTLLETTITTINNQKQERALLLFKKEELEKTQLIDEKNLKTLIALYRTPHTLTLPTISKEDLINAYDSIYKKIIYTEQQLTILRNLKELIASTSIAIQKLEQTAIHNNQQTIHEQEIIAQQIQHKKELLIQHSTQLHNQIYSYEKDLTEINTEITLLNTIIMAPDITSSLTILQKKHNKYITYLHKYHEKIRALDDQKMHLTIQINNIKDNTTTTCPICIQPLNSTQITTITHHFTTQYKHIIHQQKRLINLIKKLPNIIQQLENDLSDYHVYKKKYDAAKTKYNEQTMLMEKININIIELKDAINQLTKELAAIETTIMQVHIKINNLKQRTLADLLHENNEYEDAIKKLQTLHTQYKTIPYNNDEHIALKAQLTELDNQIRTYHTYESMILKRIQYREKIQTLCKILKKTKKSMQELDNALIPTKACDELYNDAIEKKHTLHSALETISQQYQEAITKKIRLDIELEHIAVIENEINTHSQLSASLAEMASDYQIIATALGKDGIQALLIEEAIPEIENETNILLSKLTNNQSHIIIDSLRDLKNGSTKETLDIKISDTAGIRPYELFSGGEAFRIDFALRIALSKLVAKRAGTTLQTLIIDEGFGSQDEEGLNNIMDAIYTIQNDFDKIIIVSHLPILKEQFPVHFIVQKGSQGSSIEIIEQG